MTCGKVTGWLIDFRTAEDIFKSMSNERISQCGALCEEGLMHISHCEELLFKSSEKLKEIFLNGSNCLYWPTETVMQACLALQNSEDCSSLIPNDDTPIFMAAVAVSENFGLISEPRPSRYMTTGEFCRLAGVQVLTCEQFFALKNGKLT